MEPRKKTMSNKRVRRAKSAPPNEVGRYLFLIALRNQWPAFWIDLKEEVWLQNVRDPANWARARGLTDDWIIQDVILPTLAAWTENPESGNARLERGYPWFTYRPHIKIKEFAPVFEDARPAVRGLPDVLKNKATPSGLYKELQSLYWQTKNEAFDEFAVRMAKQFSRQLKDYKQYLKSIFPEVEVRPQIEKHARWTALVVSGESCGQIAERLSNLPYAEPERAVYRAVKRFAADIGLTLRWEQKSR